MRGAALWAPAYLLLISVTLLAFAGLIGFEDTRFEPGLTTDPYILGILKFSLWQAALSTLISVALAFPIARAIYRLRPPGSSLFLKLSLLAFVMPTLVVITGAVLLLGPNGLLRPLVGETWSLYGLNGILLAHVFLNMPLAVRVLTQQYAGIPDTSLRLARQLKFSGWERFKHLELPALRPALIGVSGLIFVLCFNSFAIVLALGGGPGATTFELAIYQALKYDFNLSEALTLAWMQFTLAGIIFLWISAKSNIRWLGASRTLSANQPQSRGMSRLLMAAVYILGWLFLLSPILALLVSIELQAFDRMSFSGLGSALLQSLIIALSATLGAMLLAIALLIPIRSAAISQANKRYTLLNWLSTHTLVAPAMVLSTGLYILLLPRIDLERWGLVWLILLNLVMLVPFLITQLRPHFIQFDAQYWALVRNLKLSPIQRMKTLFPYLKTSLISTFSLGLLLALGDVSIFAIFGQYDAPTLPWLIYQYAGSYRMQEATLAATLLLAICLVLLFILERQKQDE